VLVLKGAGTIVADPHRLYINRTGNPGMATGGTGDVLTGLLGAFLAQGLAVRFASEHRVVLVLKGHGTVVTDGRQVYVNTTGNPGMATGGTGDVLTGLVAALLGQGLEPFAAAQLGVYLHGLAGDLAHAELGAPSLVATDLLHYLPRAFLRHQG